MSQTLTNTVSLSAKARSELLGLKVGKEQFLRLWVSEGGCKGKTYQAALDNQFDSADRVLYEDQDLRIVSDPDSYPWLNGLEIDYSDDLASGGFRFSNPNAAASCGCGSSFCGQ